MDEDLRRHMFSRAVADYAGLAQRIASSYEADSDLVDDLVQDVFLALWRALPSFREDSSLKTYLARIAHNVCVSHVRKETRRPTSELSVDLPDSGPTPELHADHNLKRTRLFDAVRAMKLPDRQVISLHLEGFSNREIGQMLDISEGSVAVRLTRLRKTLAETIGGAK